MKKNELEGPHEYMDFQMSIDKYRGEGDNLGVGEVLAAHLKSIEPDKVESTFASMISLWASSDPFDAEITSISELKTHADKFVNDFLAKRCGSCYIKV